ncbi:MAG: hypothetical protein ACOVP1_09830 [Bacteroidia bacterium]
MNTAVLLILFNRSDTALQVLDRIKHAGVKRLYLFSDGPRNNKEGEAETLLKVQKDIMDAIDWPCEVRTRFESKNQGPRYAIGNGINWFFEHEEQGIIFEHDCLPHSSFFSFCEELLAYYADDKRVMHISGNNFQFGIKRGEADYYFSKLNHIWGFATWKRAWNLYDVNMTNYPEFKKQFGLKSIFHHPRMQKIWEGILDKTYYKKLETWDYQWTFSLWKNNGLAILPNVNLVSNIGFDASALNTTNPNHRLASMPTYELTKINHPPFIIPHVEADEFSMLEVFNPTIGKFAWQQLKRKLNK